MAMLMFSPLTFFKWGLLACFISVSVESQPQQCDPNDVLALQEFARNLTNGSIVASWSNKSPCCRWDGVFCDTTKMANASNGDRVTMLILPKKGLEGTISGSLGRLAYLEVLDLSSNNLRGAVPRDLSNLKRLEVLDLSHNMLSGNISHVISGLKSIRVFNISSNLLSGDVFEFNGFHGLISMNVSNNSLSGSINPALCNSKLRILDFSYNRLVGDLGDLRNCSASLKQLRLDCNSLSGQIPDHLYEFSALEQLSVSGNFLSGNLSEKVGNLARLKSLHVSRNQFFGELPDIFGNLTQLEQLAADSNSFSGPLPRSLAFCSKLRVLDLRNNSLTGPIELNFTRLQNLCVLDLASNHISGSLPYSLSECRELKILSLAKNDLRGRIPDSFANLTSLLFLSLSNNSFTDLFGALSVLQQCRNLTTLILTKNFIGEEIPEDDAIGFESLMILALGNCGLKGQIPRWLLNCKKLQVLDLSWNLLDGAIPPWIGQMENLFYLDFSNNSLAGELPRNLTELKSLIHLNCSSSGLTASAGIPLYVKRNKSSSALPYNQASSFPPSILLSSNRLNGTILLEIGRLKELHVLDLSRNNITGTISESISNMGNLEVLDLSNNSLHGSIPGSFEKLTFLSKFSVAYNHLKGPIPTGGQFYSFPPSSFEGNPGLCRTIDSPCEAVDNMLKPDVQPHSARKFNKSGILGLTISMALGIFLFLLVILIRLARKDSGERINDIDEELNRLPRLSEALGGSKLVLFQSAESKQLTVSDLLRSTSSFSQANIIGCGGFGLVYKAELPDGSKAAIKRLSGDCGQMEREFQAEVEALSRAQHKNLVSLQGYCKHGSYRLLIYSYMENGSLDYWLHECVDGTSRLTWNVRLKIAQGAARGLAYLHKVCEPNIIHRDVKSSNILLDEKFEAHLADFGLSRLLRPYATHVTTDLVGTLGYIPPEYSQTLTATCRGDVYSFGVVLLELVTGRRPVEVCKGKNCRDLVAWVFQMRSEGREAEIIDSSIRDRGQEKQVLEMVEIACRCIDQDPRSRPLIEEVVTWLEGIAMAEAAQ